ncbi:hypothetical protein Plhal710r2_c058g0168431 [Plasmopara halstedii]
MASGPTARWGGVDTVFTLGSRVRHMLAQSKCMSAVLNNKREADCKTFPVFKFFNNQAKNRDEQLRLIDTLAPIY